MPDIARLSIVLDAQAARRQVADLKTELLALNAISVSVGTRATASFRQMGSAINPIRIGINSLNSVMGNFASTSTASFQRMENALNMIRISTNSLNSAMGNTMAKTQSSVASTTSSFDKLGRAIVAVFTVQRIAAFTKSAIETSLAYDRINQTLTLVGGSSQAAARDMEFLRNETQRIGIDFLNTSQAFAKFSAAATMTGLSNKQTKETFIAVAEAGRRFGLTAENQGRIFLALEQMVSKGVVSMEELRRQLGDALPGAFNIAARSMGMTTREFNKLVESGNLMTKDFLPGFTRELAKVVPAGDAVANTAADLARLSNAWNEFKASVGKSLPVQVTAQGATGIIQAMTPRGFSQEHDEEMRAIASGLGYDPNKYRGIFQGRESGEQDRRIEAAAIAEMQRREKIRENIRNAVGEAGAAFRTAGEGLFGDYFTTPTDAQNKKFNRLSRGLSDDGLEGRDAIIQSYRNQREAVAELGLTTRQYGQALELVAEAEKRALDKYDTDQSLKSESEAAKELTDAYLKAQDAAEKFYNESVGDPVQRQVNEINRKFREQAYELIQISEAGADVADAYEALKQSRDASLANARQRNVRGDNYQPVPNFRDVTESWGDLEDRIDEGSAQLAQSMDQNFTDAFTSMITGTKSVSEAFRDMATSIVTDLVRIMVQQLIVRSVMGLFGSIGGAGGGDAGVDHADFGNFNHQGGVVGKRYHRGGLVGDEVPVIARRGETVFTPEQLNALGKVISENQGGRQQKIEIVNVSRESEFVENLYRSQTAILNIIGRNAKPISRVIANAA